MRKVKKVPTSFSDWNTCICTWTHFPRITIESTRNQALSKIDLARVGAVTVVVKQNWKFCDSPGVLSWNEILILCYGCCTGGIIGWLEVHTYVVGVVCWAPNGNVRCVVWCEHVQMHNLRLTWSKLAWCGIREMRLKWVVKGWSSLRKNIKNGSEKTTWLEYVVT